MAFSYTNIVKLAGAVTATIVLTLLWLHRSSQQRVDRSLAHSVKVALRLLVIHALAIYVLCIAWRVPVNAYVGMAALAFFIAAVDAYAAPGDDIVAFIFGILI